LGIFRPVVDVELVLVVRFSDSFSGSEGSTDLGLVLGVVLAKVKLPANLWRRGRGRILAPVSGALL
jgi:hypothetical protein